eukprot:g5112.t1
MLRTDEQRHLYEALKSVASQPDELDSALKTWVQRTEEDSCGSYRGSRRRRRHGKDNMPSSPLERSAFASTLALLRDRSGEDLFTATLSGLVNGLLAVAFNCVKATLVFGQSTTTTAWIPVGVCMYHFATIVTGSSMTALSDCKIALGGPNINHPLIFGPTIVAAIVTSITGVSDTGAHRRRLTTTTTGEDYDEDELLSSIIFAMALSTLITSICWFGLGHFRLTRAVQFLPEFVVSGFIASVGYLIMLKAIFVATGFHVSFEVTEFEVDGMNTSKFYYLLAPALAIGVPMFFTKHYHIGKTAYVLPAFLVVPLVLFYIVLAVGGISIDEARESGWFLDKFEFTPFYKPWTSISVSKVNFGIVFEQLPDMIVLTFVLTIQALLNLVAVRNEYDVELDYDREMRLCGAFNFVNTAGFAAPGYLLLKMTAKNHGIIQNVEDRLPGVIYSLFAAVIYASGYPIINLFPRFFLSALVVWAGFGFIWMHAVVVYGRMPRLEYATILAIVLITALTQLTYAVVSGILLALLIFVWKYARRGAIRTITYGSESRSNVVRSYRDEQSLTHLGQLFVVVELHRFLFFGSVIGVQGEVKDVLRERSEKPAWKRERYLLLDFHAVDGIDITATMVFTQIAKSCLAAGVEVLASGMNEKTRTKFSTREDGWTDIVRVFVDADTATEWVENQLLRHASEIRRRWLCIEPLRKLHAQTVLKAKHEVYEELLGGHLGESLWQYVRTERVERGQLLCQAGEKNNRLYLLQSGRLTCYVNFENVERSSVGSGRRRVRMMTWLRGAYVNEDSLFLDMPVSHTIVADETSIVLVITRQKWLQLEADDPMVALQIQRTVMMHSAIMRDTLERRLNILNSFERTSSSVLSSSERKGSRGAQLTSHEKFASSVKLAVNVYGQSVSSVSVAPISTRRRRQHRDSVIGGSVANFQSSHDFHHIPHNRRKHSFSSSSSHVVGSGGDRNGGGVGENRSGASPSSHASVEATTHMSRRMVKLTKACFRKHMSGGRDNDDDDDDDTGKNLGKTYIGWVAPPSPANGPKGAKKCCDDEESERIEFKDAQDALMDLGKFPTLEELKSILKQIAKSRGVAWTVFKTSLRKGVTLSVFLNIVSAMDLADISSFDMRDYRRVFNKYAVSGCLSAESLGLLMNEMHHPEKPLELQKLMAEWSVERDQLDFNNFVSMMAHFLKMEELDEEVEEVFKSFCHRWSGSGTFDAADLRTKMQSEYGIDLTPQEASEMVWEADLNGDDCLSYSTFRNSVTMVSDVDLKEAYGYGALESGRSNATKTPKRETRHADKSPGSPPTLSLYS